MELISPSPQAHPVPAPRSPVKAVALTEALSGLSALAARIPAVTNGNVILNGQAS